MAHQRLTHHFGCMARLRAHSHHAESSQSPLLRKASRRAKNQRGDR
jgi:hypothetical protein